MRALITGHCGFVGQHLRTVLEGQDKSVVGYDIKSGQDLKDYEQLRNYLDYHRPDEIYHLAAQAYVPESMSCPQRTFEVNVGGTINLLEAVKNLGIKTKIQLAGTSEEYGDAGSVVPKSHFAGEVLDPTRPIEMTVTEHTMPNPLSPYAVSKLAMDKMGLWYAKAYGLHVVVTRAFNHAGSGRGEMYAESSFAKQIVEIERGERDFIEHGNLETVRNYTDVRDVVRAYTKAINLKPDVYNICSDNNITVQELLDMLVSHSKVEVKTKVNPALFRKSDFSFNPPSCDKFKNLTDWSPRIPLEETMKSVLEYWRDK